MIAMVDAVDTVTDIAEWTASIHKLLKPIDPAGEQLKSQTLELLTPLNLPSIKEEVRPGNFPGLPDLPASRPCMD